MATSTPPLIEGWAGAIWIHSVGAVPWVVLIVGLGLWFVEPELEEEALLNASAARVFRRVTCRRAAAAAGAAALWVAITTAGEMTITDVFQIRTYAEETYTQIVLGDEPELFSSSNLPAFLAVGWLIAAGLVLVSRLAPHHRHASQRQPWRFRLGRWRWPLGLAAWTLVLLLVAVPLGSLIYKAGAVVTRTDSGWLRGWSAARCVGLVLSSPARSSEEFRWSLVIGTLASTAAVALALPLAWSARRGGLRALPACVVTAVCLALPGPALGLSLIRFFNQPNCPLLNFLYDRSIAAPWVAQLVRALPLAILVLWHSLSTVPDEFLEMAATDGAGRFASFRRIAIASRRRGLAVAWLVALAVALGELAASILVVPPGVSTLAIQIFGLIHFGVYDQVAGICLSLAACLGLIGAVVLKLTSRKED